MRTPFLAWWLVLGGVGATGVGAQVARTVHTPILAVADAVQAGDEAHTALRPMDALDRFRDALDVDPDSYPALWRASREALALGALAADDDDRRRWREAAVTYARHATDVNSDGVEGHAWLARTLWASLQDRSVGARARGSADALAAARRALALDPANPAAHGVIGAWHADIMRLSPVARWAVRHLVGPDAVDGASWQDAEVHLRLAAEAAEPAGLTYHLALGRVLLDAGRRDEGRACLRLVLERPSVEPEDPMIKQRAQELLSRS